MCTILHSQQKILNKFSKQSNISFLSILRWTLRWMTILIWGNQKIKIFPILWELSAMRNTQKTQNYLIDLKKWLLRPSKSKVSYIVLLVCSWIKTKRMGFQQGLYPTFWKKKSLVEGLNQSTHFAFPQDLQVTGT